MYGLGIAQILQIYWIYKDAIDLTSRWEVRFRQTFFQNEVQRVLYKLVLVTYPLDHSRRICSPSNFRFSQKTKKIKFVPITIIILPKINLEHLELLRSWGGGGGLRSSSLEAPGLHDTNFNAQCYKDAIDLTSTWKVRFRQTFFKMKPKRCSTSRQPVLVSDLISHSE